MSQSSSGCYGEDRYHNLSVVLSVDVSLWGAQALPDLRNFRTTQFQKKKEEKNWNINIFEKRNEFFLCWNERKMALKWRKDAVGWYHNWSEGHSVVDRLSSCWGVDFNRTVLYINLYLTAWIEEFDLSKIRLAPNLSEHNYCPSLAMCMLSYAFNVGDSGPDFLP